MKLMGLESNILRLRQIRTSFWQSQSRVYNIKNTVQALKYLSAHAVTL